MPDCLPIHNWCPFYAGAPISRKVNYSPAGIPYDFTGADITLSLCKDGVEVQQLTTGNGGISTPEPTSGDYYINFTYQISSTLSSLYDYTITVDSTKELLLLGTMNFRGK